MKTLFVLISLLITSLSFAHHFTGTYQNAQYGVTVTIQHGTDGNMQGQVSGNGIQLQLQGFGNEQGAQGVLRGPQGQLSFTAQISQDLNQLYLVLYEADARGQVNPNSGQQLILTRVNSTPTPGPQPGPFNPGPQPTPPGPQPGPFGPQPVPPVNNLNNPWNGTYVGDNGQIMLTLEYTQGGINGSIKVDGYQFSFFAMDSNGTLSSEIQAEGQSFPVLVERSSNGIALTIGSATYMMQPYGMVYNPPTN